MTVTIINVIINGLVMGGIYSLIAIGLNLQYGVARVLNIAHGEFIMVGAFLTWQIYTMFGFNPLISLVISGPIVFLIGFILYKTVFTRISLISGSAEVFESNSMLASFGLMYILQNLAILIWKANVRGYSFLNYPVVLGGATIPANRLVMFALALLIGLVFYIFLARTRLGKAIRAASQDPVAAGLMGVDIKLVLTLCFGLGALMAGLAGSLLSMSFQISPMMGFDYTIIAIIVIVLGGLGNIVGSFIGGFLLGIISAIINMFQPSLSMIAFYLLFMIILMVKPNGILGR